MRNKCQEPLVLCDRRAWIVGMWELLLVAAARGEKSERRNAEGQMLHVMLEPLMWNRVDCATREEVEMIGESEINDLLLPEVSRGEQAGRAEKLNNSCCPAHRLQRAHANRPDMLFQ